MPWVEGRQKYLDVGIITLLAFKIVKKGNNMRQKLYNRVFIKQLFSEPFSEKLFNKALSA